MHVRDIREPVSTMQRCKPAEAIKAATADYAEPAPIATPPGVEKVARSNWEPAKAAPTAKAASEAKAATPTEERYIRRRPERTIKSAAINRTRPPGPRAAVGEPATVVIRRPPPRLVANPRPTVVGLVGPVAITIRNPAIGFVRNPDIAVVRNILPTTVGIQILRAGVITVGMTIGVGVLDRVIAVAVPAIPVVARRSCGNLVLRGLSIATHGRHVSLMDLGAALRGGDLRFALGHDHDGVTIGPDLDAEGAIMVRRMDGNVRGINLRLGFSVFRNVEVRDALGQLNLDGSFRERREVDLSVRTQAKNIREVELQFGAGVVSGGDFVAGHRRLIQRGRGPVAGIAALGRHIAVNQADAGHTLIGLRRRFARRSTRLCLSWLCVGGLTIIRPCLHRLRFRTGLTDLHGRTRLIRGRGPFIGRLCQRAERER